jgi:hypothetical protein
MRLLALALAAVLPSFSMTKCVDVEHTLTLMPDGSGKLAVTLTLPKDDKTDALKMVGLFAEMFDGMAAWTSGDVRKVGESGIYTLTGYFEDIGAVKCVRDGDGKPLEEPILTYALTRDGEKRTLTVRDGMIKEILEDAAKPPAEGEKPGANDDLYAFRITVPAAITGTSGLPKPAGRTVEVRVDQTLVSKTRFGDAAAKARIAELAAEFRVSWTGSDVKPEETAAFQKELSAAKRAWKDLEPKAKAALKKKKD